MAANWRLLEPTVHRPPLPTVLVHAMIVLSFMLGWRRWAGVTLTAFHAPGRIGEVLRACRADLLLPSDNLYETKDRALLHVASPKSRYRGGALSQHMSVVGPLLVAYLQAIFGELPRSLPLYPFSPSTYRKRWEFLLSRLLITSGKFKPGGLRGGGAVSLYLADMPIADIQWRMRLKQQATLGHYIQEVVALTSMSDATDAARREVSSCARLFEPIARSLLATAATATK